MREIVVEHQGDRSARVRIGPHQLVVDQPFEDGGWDLGPMPTELFVAGLAACVEYYAGQFLFRHGLNRAGLRVECRFEMSEDRPARVSRIELKVIAPALPPARLEALLAVVQHCTVHNSLRQAPDVAIAVEEQRTAA